MPVMPYGSFVPGVGGGGWDSLQTTLGGQSPFLFTDVEQFRRAVTAGYGTDVAALSGGGALRLQSLEPQLLATIQQESDFKLLRLLDASNAEATVDEYTIKRAIGGWPGSSFNFELGAIGDRSSTYERRVGLVKYLMTKRSVTVVQKSQRTLVDTIADQTQDATLELLTSAEWGILYGDSGVSPVEFDGIIKQVRSEAPQNIIDLGGNPISGYGAEVVTAAQQIADYGHFGRATHVIWSNMVQADMNMNLDPAYRVVAPNQVVSVGTPVTGVRTSWGDLIADYDIFIQEGGPPFVDRPGPNFQAAVANSGLSAPTVTAPTAAPNAQSRFSQTIHAGNYYYAVEAGSKDGRSTPVVTAQVAVAVGDAVTFTINDTPSNPSTFYVVYRSRKNGSNQTSDMREMVRIPRTGNSTTFVDLNANIPGTSHVFVLDLRPSDKAMTLRRLLPMVMFPLYPTNTAEHPWAQLLFLYLRVGKPLQHVVLTNVLPRTQRWRPFGV